MVPYLGADPRAEPVTEADLVVFATYIDSWLFVFATAILQFGVGVDSALPVCGAAILLCLVFYVTTKVRHSLTVFLAGTSTLTTLGGMFTRHPTAIPIP